MLILIVFLALILLVHAGTSGAAGSSGALVNYHAGQAESALHKINGEPSFWESKVAYIATLDGNIHAIDAESGETLWTFEGDSLLENPYGNYMHESEDDNGKVAPLLNLIPDPRDGSLYIHDPTDGLQKFFSIPDLVALAPFRVDGRVYMGTKASRLLAINQHTGKLVREYSTSTVPDEDKIDIDHDCPHEDLNIIHIGRVDYTFWVKDERTNRQIWNVTFSQYQSAMIDAFDGKGVAGPSKGSSDYHIVSDTDGIVYSIGDGSTKELTWSVDLGSPPVAHFGNSHNTLEEVAIIPTLDAGSGTPVRRAGWRAGWRSRFFTRRRHGHSQKLWIQQSNNNLLALSSYYTGLQPINRQVQGLISESRSHLPREEPSSNDGECNRDSAQYPFCLYGAHDVKSSSWSLRENKEWVNWLSSATGIITLLTTVVAVFASTYYMIGRRRKSLPQTPSQQIRDNITEKVNGNLVFMNPPSQSDFSTTSSQGESVSKTFYTEAPMNSASSESRNDDSSQQPLNSDSHHSTGTVRSVPERGAAETQSPQVIEVSDERIGIGSMGTVVYKGGFSGRPVAVKRLPKVQMDIAQQEIDSLLRIEAHTNVVHYYCQEETVEHIYIALELCDRSLEQYLKHGLQNGNYPTRTEIVRYLRHIAKGLQHLHDCKIVHRDLKPHNVLLQGDRAKISDFGLARPLAEGHESFYTQCGGTEGWHAPETLRDGRMTRAVDIFSMGLIYFYTLTGCRHPYGDFHERRANIFRGVAPNMDALSSDPTARLLIQDLLVDEATARPDCATVLAHPMFWTNRKQMDFLTEVSNQLEGLGKNHELIKVFDEYTSPALGEDWHAALEPEILADLIARRGYNKQSGFHLLRAIRNKRNHYSELSDDLKTIYGSKDDGYVRYWLDRFPLFLTDIYRFVQDQMADDETFSPYLS
eukprot:Clim_evm12s207 gene=Clim_evmTU12s207